jgi:oligo-1,6-glucosidase
VRDVPKITISPSDVSGRRARIFIENHDLSRSVTRFGNDSDRWRGVSAKMLALLEITLGGTQYVYQGQELGLKNFPRSWGIEEYKDVASQNYWNK